MRPAGTSTCATTTSSTSRTTRRSRSSRPSIEAIDEDSLKIIGNLTIKDTTNEVELLAEVGGTEVDPWGNDRVGLEAVGKISRSDFGIKFQMALGSGNVAVADKVTLNLDVSAVKGAA